MNVTNDRFKDRQLHNEDYLQMVSAEQKEYGAVWHFAVTVLYSFLLLLSAGISPRT